MTALVDLIMNSEIFLSNDRNFDWQPEITGILAQNWPIFTHFCDFEIFSVKMLKIWKCHSIRMIFAHILVHSDFDRISRNFRAAMEISDNFGIFGRNLNTPKCSQKSCGSSGIFIFSIFWPKRLQNRKMCKNWSILGQNTDYFGIPVEISVIRQKYFRIYY